MLILCMAVTRSYTHETQQSMSLPALFNCAALSSTPSGVKGFTRYFSYTKCQWTFQLHPTYSCQHRHCLHHLEFVSLCTSSKLKPGGISSQKRQPNTYQVFSRNLCLPPTIGKQHWLLSQQKPISSFATSIDFCTGVWWQNKIILKILTVHSEKLNYFFGPQKAHGFICSAASSGFRRYNGNVTHL